MTQPPTALKTPLAPVRRAGGRLKLRWIEVDLAALQASPDFGHERCDVVRPRARLYLQLRVGGQLKGGAQRHPQCSVSDARAWLGALARQTMTLGHRGRGRRARSMSRDVPMPREPVTTTVPAVPSAAR